MTPSTTTSPESGQEPEKDLPSARLAWEDDWLDSVADGRSTMSQRRLSSIEKRGDRLEAVKAIAEQKGIHLLLLEDDQGNEIIAASKKPFTVVC